MKKQYKGSLTVEASILIPFILFLLMALVYLLFFLHDCTLMQSYGIRTAEKLLWQPDGETAEDIQLLMMELTNISYDKTDIVSEIFDWLCNRETVQVQLEGDMTVGVPGSSVFTGSNMRTAVSAGAIKIRYTEDRLKTVLFKNREKKDE